MDGTDWSHRLVARRSFCGSSLLDEEIFESGIVNGLVEGKKAKIEQTCRRYDLGRHDLFLRPEKI